jgi:hypothetical protein
VAQPAHFGERVALVAASAQGGLLHAAADLVDGGEAQFRDVKRVQHVRGAG